MSKDKINLKVNGWRGVTLLIGAVFCIVRFIAYIPSNQPQGALRTDSLRILDSFIPLGVWSGVWLLIGIICAVFAFKREDAIAFGLLTGVWIFWGLAYLFGWIGILLLGQESRDWLSATTYLCPALIFALTSSHIPANFTIIPKGDKLNDILNK